MSRSLYVLPAFLVLLAACGDPYAAPKTDGGVTTDGHTSINPGEDGGTDPEDTGGDPEDTKPREDVGTAGDPCTSPGKTENSTCGSCGKRLRVCGSDLKWSTWSECDGEGICSPGEKDSEACGTSGSRSRTCSSSCTWGSFGECIGDAPTCGFIGKTESEACGNCGTRTRTCGSTGWGTWSSCTGEGVCAPGATESAACTTGGTKSRTCSSTCTWGLYGTCTGTTTGTGCASTVTTKQTFTSGSFSAMYGCQGSVTWASAYTLCATGYHVCSAAEFQSRRGTTVPNHHYWPSDYMNGSGSEGACKASKSTTGNFCPTDAPMRVCGSSKYDTSGNYCTWVACGYESTSSSLYWGGCNDDGSGNGDTAGALCCN
jgi:hypothetical protein